MITSDIKKLQNLTQIETEIIYLLSNDIRVKDIGKHIGKSESMVEKILRRIKDDNDINTNHGLVGEFLIQIYNGQLKEKINNN